jgi:hypothetical protein
MRGKIDTFTARSVFAFINDPIHSVIVALTIFKKRVTGNPKAICCVRAALSLFSMFVTLASRKVINLHTGNREWRESGESVDGPKSLFETIYTRAQVTVLLLTITNACQQTTYTLGRG